VPAGVAIIKSPVVGSIGYIIICRVSGQEVTLAMSIKRVVVCVMYYTCASYR
jgi:hypothetical protein